MLKSVLLSLILVYSGSNQQCFKTHYPIKNCEKETWITSYHNFSVTLLKSLNKAVKEQDVMFSPLAIQEGLLLAYFGAKYETHSAIARVLQLPRKQNKAATWKLYYEQKLRRGKFTEKTYPLKIANKIYLSEEFPLYDCLKVIFKEELEQIDFGNFFNTKRTIYEWVREQTDSEVGDQLNEISPLSSAAIVNAAHFTAKWEKGFNEYMTVLLPFQSSQFKSELICMMYHFDFFDEGYSSELRARLLLLPFEGKEIAMIILLPDEDLDSMIESMNENTIQSISDRGRYKSSYISIFIPRFTYKNKINMLHALSIMGIGSSFTKFADFSYFTGKKDVFFDFFNHVSAIEVAESGKSPAMRFPSIMNVSVEFREDFICDRPFAYIIYDYSKKATIFMGIFRDPQPLNDDDALFPDKFPTT